MIKQCDLETCNHQILGNEVYTLKIRLFGDFEESDALLGSSMDSEKYYHSKQCMLTALDMAKNNVDKRLQIVKEMPIGNKVIHVQAVLVDEFSIKGLTA